MVLISIENLKLWTSNAKLKQNPSIEYHNRAQCFHLLSAISRSFQVLQVLTDAFAHYFKGLEIISNYVTSFSTISRNSNSIDYCFALFSNTGYVSLFYIIRDWLVDGRRNSLIFPMHTREKTTSAMQVLKRAWPATALITCGRKTSVLEPHIEAAPTLRALHKSEKTPCRNTCIKDRGCVESREWNGDMFGHEGGPGIICHIYAKHVGAYIHL